MVTVLAPRIRTTSTRNTLRVGWLLRKGNRESRLSESEGCKRLQWKISEVGFGFRVSTENLWEGKAGKLKASTRSWANCSPGSSVVAYCQNKGNGNNRMKMWEVGQLSNRPGKKLDSGSHLTYSS
jgi:hypothetical protein